MRFQWLELYVWCALWWSTLGCGANLRPATPSELPPPPPTSAAAAPASGKSASTEVDEYRQLIDDLAKRYRSLGRNIDISGLDIVVADQDRAARDIATSFEDFTMEGQFEALSTLACMAGAPQKPDAAHLRRLALANLTEKLHGYYDPRASTVAFRDVELVRLMGRVGLNHLLAHELGHAYQDQRVGGLRAWARSHHRSLDSLRAAHLVMEGHAELMALELALAREDVSLSQVKLDFADATLGRVISGASMSAIYAAGKDFALTLHHTRGGWPTVDRALLSPPSSTEQVLHPEKLGTDLPRDVPLPEPIPAAQDGQVVFDSTIGEFLIYSQLLFSARSLDEAFIAACGWDGDRLRVLRLPDGSTAAVWRSLWDRPEDAEQFAAQVGRWAQRSRLTKTHQTGHRVDLVYAESDTLRDSLVASMTAAPSRFEPNTEDVASTVSAESRRLAAMARQPRLENGRWVMPEHGMSFAVPQGFRHLTVQGSDLLAGQVDDGFAENVMVVFTQDFRDGDLDRHLEDTRRQLASSGQQLASARRARLGNVDGALVEVALSAQDHEVRTYMALVLRPDKVVMITYAGLAKNWRQGKQTAERLFASIRIED